MDSMVAIALVGTARQPQAEVLSGTPVDELLAELPKGETERRLLLNAGAHAVYCQAGVKAREIASGPEPATSETLRVCAPGATALLANLLRISQRQPELLFEAIERMRQQGLCLPYQLLPQALNSSGKEVRSALAPVLGERGRWLSQFNPAWQWVAQQAYLPAHASTLPGDAETLWQEGTPGQRVEILRRVRTVDPAQARVWLAGVWKQEKAEMRCTLLAVLENGLSVDDEDFLERALDDRASSVRASATNLLARLPDSAFSTRMRARGSAMLHMVDGRLGLEFPAEFARDWERDGLGANPPEQVGQRARWLIQVLATIPPTFWESHFAATPSELLQRLPADHWQVILVEGWSRAAITYHASAWLPTLWAWWDEYRQNTPAREQAGDPEIYKQLLKAMPGSHAEKIMLDRLNASEEGPSDDWCKLLPHLPRPWSVEFAQVYLRFLRERYSPEALEKFDTQANPQIDPWLDDLSGLAADLPVAILAKAVTPWEFPKGYTWQITYTRQHLQEFTETVRIRKKIQKELI